MKKIDIKNEKYNVPSTYYRIGYNLFEVVLF